MATEKKIFKQASKRSASGTAIQTDQVISNVLQTAIEWSNDHEFISPNEVYMNAIGLLFCLTTRRLINISFTNLYRRSLKITWTNLLNRERRNLKSNINSVAKCFMINRLIAECLKDPLQFARQTGELYEEIKTRLSSKVISTWTVEDFYGQVLTRRNLQCQRRLFHISHNEANQPQSLLTLQQIGTVLFSQFLNSCQINPTMENYNNLKQLLRHCFIIVAQPSIPECVAATKYEKLNNTYSAKLFTRIICLLDPDKIENYSTLSNVGVTLYPFDRNLDIFGEDQPALKWQKRPIIDADETLRYFLYVELESIELKKLDVRNSRPLYSAKLCQLQFQFKIRINEINIEENLILLSQLFGLCSHAQYYPEYVAKVLLYEVTQTNNSIIQPNILANYIYRYHTRISGVEPKLHTSGYITDLLRIAYEEKKGFQNTTSFGVYEEIIAKLISQIEMYIDYPFLSTMYHDGLFLGICNNTLDQQLFGNREQPHILLRFNSLLTHQPTQHASVRFIVHNGQLIRATFHPKAFVDEMCRMICEANSHQAKNMQFLFEIPNRNFHAFCLYFDNELFRLNTAASPLKDAYQPLIPVLWNTMRINTDEQTRQIEEQFDSPSLLSELIPEDSSRSNTPSLNEIQIDLSNTIMTTDSSKSSDERMIIQNDILIRHLVEKFTDLLIKSSTTENVSSTSANITTASTLLSTLNSGDIQQQKELLSRLLFDSFQSKTHVEVATQTSPPTSHNSPVNISEDTYNFLTHN